MVYIIAELAGIAVGHVIIALYFLAYRPWKDRRREARQLAEYRRRCAALIPPWERKQEVAQRIADAKARMGLS